MAQGSVNMRYNQFIREKAGVSPIIATILMVAVTVVLASVLYVMIVGMGSGSADLAPLGIWSSSDITGNTTATYTFGSFSYDVIPIDIKIIVQEGDNQTFTEFTGRLQNKTTPMFLTGNNTDTMSITYQDNNWGANTIGGGDKLFISGLQPDTVYTVRVFHKPSDQIIQMTGDSSSIQTLP